MDDDTSSATGLASRLTRLLAGGLSDDAVEHATQVAVSHGELFVETVAGPVAGPTEDVEIGGAHGRRQAARPERHRPRCSRRAEPPGLMTSQDKVALGPIDDIAISLIGLSAAGELPVASAGVAGGAHGAPWLSGVADGEVGGRP